MRRGPYLSTTFMLVLDLQGLPAAAAPARESLLVAGITCVGGGRRAAAVFCAFEEAWIALQSKLGLSGERHIELLISALQRSAIFLVCFAWVLFEHPVDAERLGELIVGLHSVNHRVFAVFALSG